MTSEDLVKSGCKRAIVLGWCLSIMTLATPIYLKFDSFGSVDYYIVASFGLGALSYLCLGWGLKAYPALGSILLILVQIAMSVSHSLGRISSVSTLEINITALGFLVLASSCLLLWYWSDFLLRPIVLTAHGLFLACMGTTQLSVTLLHSVAELQWQLSIFHPYVAFGFCLTGVGLISFGFYQRPLTELDTSELLKLTLGYAGLAIPLICFLGVALAVLPLHYELRARSQKGFERNLHTLGTAISEHIKGLKLQSSQIATRTRARILLEEFTAGSISYESFRNGTEPILHDALPKSSQLLGITRVPFRADGVVSVGQLIPSELLAENLNFDESIRFGKPFYDTSGQEIRIVLYTLITRSNGSRLGFDATIYRLDNLHAMVKKHLDSPGKIVESLQLVVHPLDGPVLQVKTDGIVIEPHSRDKILAGARFQSWAELDEQIASDPFLYAVRLDHVGWVVVTRIIPSSLYASEDTSLLWALVAVAFLTTVACRGIFYVAHPIAMEIQTRAERMLNEVREVAEERSRKELQWRLTFENAPIGIMLVAPDGKCVEVNRALCDIFGYSPEEFQQLHIKTLIHPDDLMEELTLVQEVLEDKRKNFRLSRRYIHKDGHSIWIQVDVSLLRDSRGNPVHLISQIQDISERIVSEQRFRLLSDNSPALVAYFDSARVCRFVNDRTCEWLGRARENFLGVSLEQVLGWFEFSGSETIPKGTIDSNSTFVDLKATHRSGLQRWMSLSFVIEESSQCAQSGLFMFGLDVHDLKSLSLDLARSNHDLAQFAYVASHDLRAPLRAITNYSSWIYEDCAELLPEKSRTHLDRIGKRAKRMDKLLQELLAYSRIGSEIDEVSEVDTGTLVHEISELLTDDNSLNIIVEGHLPIIRSAKAPLEQVLRNLISNAVKYHDKADGWIKIAAEESEDQVMFSVSDNGPGIEPSAQTRVFEMFQTLQPKDHNGGSGMGLAFVKRLVEGRNCKVSLESIPGEGSVFSFTWPKLHDVIKGESYASI